MKLRSLFAVPFAALMLALPLAACQTSSEPAAADLFDTTSEAQATRITADSFWSLRAGEQLVLSTSGEAGALVFDPSRGAIDFGRIQLICPNGQKMQMDLWLLDLAKQQGVDVQALIADEFVLGQTKEDAIEVIKSPQLDGALLWTPQRMEECPIMESCCYDTCVHQTCYLCSDGQWVCYCDQWATTCSMCCTGMQ